MAITLERLRAFCAVADSGSLSAAARQLFTSKAAVSLHIKELERQCGRPLLVRERHRITLTKEGEIFYDRAHRILQEVSSLERLCARFTTHRRLRIGWTPCAATPRLLHALWGSSISTPRYCLDIRFISSYEVAECIRDGRLDAGIVTAEAAHGLAAVPVFTDRIVLVGRVPNWSPYLLDDPDRCPQMLIHSYHGWVARRVLELYPWLRSHAIVVNDLLALKQAVLAGLGIAFLPRWCIASELTAGTVATLPVHGLSMSGQWMLVFPQLTPVSDELMVIHQMLSGIASDIPREEQLDALL
jgi:DNA-binding transcriptional LysR family regulator